MKSVLYCLGIFFVLLGCKKEDSSTPDNQVPIPPPFTPSDTVTDIDGNQYGTVIIGNKRWMKSNLRVKRYRNGDPIPVVSSSAWGTLTSGAYCNFINDTSISNVHGLLYNFYTVIDSRNLCPTGWHVPSDFEVTQLTDSLGGELIAAGALKSTDTLYWNLPNVGASNSSGFSAFGSGTRAGSTCNVFGGLKNQFFMWTSTSHDSTRAYSREMTIFTTKVTRYWTTDKNFGMSVRCISD